MHCTTKQYKTRNKIHFQLEMLRWMGNKEGKGGHRVRAKAPD